MYQWLVFSIAVLITAIHGEQSTEPTLRPFRRGSVEKNGTVAEPTTIQSKGISLEQLLAFTRGLLAADVVETSFKLADKNEDGLLDDDEARRASEIGNSLSQHKLQEHLTDAEKSEDGLIELNEAKLVAQRVGLDIAEEDLAAAADKEGLLTPNDVERVLNSHPSRTPLHAIFGRFDEDSDGNWSREEMDKFINIMLMDRPRWLKAVPISSFNNGQLTEFGIDDLLRAMQLYS